MPKLPTRKKFINRSSAEILELENFGSGNPYLVKDTQTYEGDFKSIAIREDETTFDEVLAVDADNVQYDFLAHSNILTTDLFNISDYPLVSANRFVSITLGAGAVRLDR